MRVLWFLLTVLVIVICGAVAAVFYAPSRLDPARVRAALERVASEHLGATVTIDGPVRFSLLPRPVLLAERVSLLHGAPGDSDALAITADTMSARLDLRDLLTGHFAAAEIILDGAFVQAPFPFDVRVLTVGRPASLRSTTIVVRHARVRAGPHVMEQVDATLNVDRLTGNTALSGDFRMPDGSAWRGSLRLGRAGGDGAAAFDASLEQIYAAEGLTASVSGQLGGAGAFSGRLTAAGPDLSWLLPAPKLGFAVTGRLSLAGGLATLEDAALRLDGLPCRLEATVHLAPAPRLGLRLEASRLDLDGFARAFAGAGVADWPLDVDLAAESATFAGGEWRDVRMKAAIEGHRIDLGDGSGTAPGGMSVRAKGAIDLAAATSHFDVDVDAPDLRAAGPWLGHLTGLDSGPASPLPLRALTGRASVETAGREIEAHDLTATLDGATLRGEATLSYGGTGQAARPRLAAILTMDRLDLTPWMAWSHAAAPAPGGTFWPWSGLDASVKLTTPFLSLPGVAGAALDADVAVDGGALTIHDLTAQTPDWQAAGSGRRGSDAAWTDVSARLTASRAATLLPVLVPLLPDAVRDRLVGISVLMAHPLSVRVTGVSTGLAPSGNLLADLGDLHVEATREQASDTGAVAGHVLLRHPDAVALAAQFGLPLDFLGPGRLDAAAEVTVAGNTVTADALRLRAGGLTLAGDLRAEAAGDVPLVTGRIQADTLPLPTFAWRGRAPLPLTWLQGWAARVDLGIAAAHGMGIDLSAVRSQVALAQGVASLRDMAASLEDGGRVSGSVTLDAAALPPRASADLSFTGLRLAPQGWHPLDLEADGLDGTARLQARGFAPAALLATLAGDITATAARADLTGIGVEDLGGDVSDRLIRTALSGGRTRLQDVSVQARLDQGLASVQMTAAASGGVRLRASGTVDVPDSTVDLGLVVLPAIPDPPPIGLLLSGPLDQAVATPALRDLARWRMARP